MFQPSLFPDDLDHVLAHTRDAWAELRGQRLFITGGTGFFGMWLLESFLWANNKLGLEAEATVLTRDPARFAAKAPHLAAHPSLRFCQGDVQDFIFPEGEYRYVIHAATPARESLNREDPLTMLDIIVRGTRRVLEFAITRGSKKFLLTSSGGVYGRQPPEVTHLSEEYVGGPDTVDAKSAYGEGKRVAELLCGIFARKYGLEAKTARCFAFVGPYLPLDEHYAIGNFLRDALAGGPICVQGDGTPRRSYLYASDLAIWLWTILFHGQSCRPYNVGSDADLAISELAAEVAARVAPEAEVKIALQAKGGGPPSRYVPDVRRARDELGLAVRVPLAEALDRTAAWQRQTMTGTDFASIRSPSKN